MQSTRITHNPSRMALPPRVSVGAWGKIDKPTGRRAEHADEILTGRPKNYRIAIALMVGGSALFWTAFAVVIGS